MRQLLDIAGRLASHAERRKHELIHLRTERLHGSVNQTDNNAAGVSADFRSQRKAWEAQGQFSVRVGPCTVKLLSTSSTLS